MADKADVVLEQDTVRVLRTGESPVVDVEGGHWNLSESDGDLRIGDAENMLKMGVATGGGGAGNARIWASSILRLGSNGSSVARVDDTGVHPHDGDLSLGTTDSPWRTGYITLLATDELYGSESLQLGHADGAVFSVDNAEGEYGGNVRPRADNVRLGTSDNRWWTTHFDRSNVNVLNVEEGVLSSLVPQQTEGGEFSVGPGNLGSEDKPWGTVYADEVNAETTTTPSDRRLKTDVEDLEGGLDAVLDLRPVSYSWRDGDDGTNLGLVAQEVADVLPEVVTGADDDGHLGLDYPELVAVLVDAVQDQQAEKEALSERADRQQERIEEQSERIEDLEERLAALEAAA